MTTDADMIRLLLKIVREHQIVFIRMSAAITCLEEDVSIECGVIRKLRGRFMTCMKDCLEHLQIVYDYVEDMKIEKVS